MLHTYHKPANTRLITLQHQLTAMHHVLASYKHMLQCHADQQQTASHVQLQVSSCMGPADLAIGQLFKVAAAAATWSGATAVATVCTCVLVCF
jgi:hypothetical protein